VIVYSVVTSYTTWLKVKTNEWPVIGEYITTGHVMTRFYKKVHKRFGLRAACSLQYDNCTAFFIIIIIINNNNNNNNNKHITLLIETQARYPLLCIFVIMYHVVHCSAADTCQDICVFNV